MSAPVTIDAERTADRDHGVESIDLVVDPVGLATTDACHALTPSVALHEARIAEHPDGDVGILRADVGVDVGQIGTHPAEIGHLVLGGSVAARRGDAADERFGPVLPADGRRSLPPIVIVTIVPAPSPGMWAASTWLAMSAMTAPAHAMNTDSTPSCAASRGPGVSSSSRLQSLLPRRVDGGNVCARGPWSS